MLPIQIPTGPSLSTDAATTPPAAGSEVGMDWDLALLDVDLSGDAAPILTLSPTGGAEMPTPSDPLQMWLDQQTGVSAGLGVGQAPDAAIQALAQGLPAMPAAGPVWPDHAEADRIVVEEGLADGVDADGAMMDGASPALPADLPPAPVVGSSAAPARPDMPQPRPEAVPVTIAGPAPVARQARPAMADTPIRGTPPGFVPDDTPPPIGPTLGRPSEGPAQIQPDQARAAGHPDPTPRPSPDPVPVAAGPRMAAQQTATPAAADPAPVSPSDPAPQPGSDPVQDLRPVIDGQIPPAASRASQVALTNWQPAQIDPRPVLQQVADAVITTREDRTEIALSPEELGRVRLILSGPDRTQITIWAERPETLDLLRRNADLLNQQLADAGVGSGSLDFRQQDRGAWPDEARQGTRDDDDIPLAALTRIALTPTQLSDRRLDIRI